MTCLPNNMICFSNGRSFLKNPNIILVLVKTSIVVKKLFNRLATESQKREMLDSVCIDAPGIRLIFDKRYTQVN